MKINDQYYTDTNTTIDDDNALRYTPFSMLPINSQFDISGAYGMSGGVYSPLCNQGVIYGGDYYKRDTSITDVTTYTHCDMTQCNAPYNGGSIRPLFMTRSRQALGQGGYAGMFCPLGRNNKSLGTISSYTTTWDDTSIQAQWFWAPTAGSYSGQLASSYNGELVNGFKYYGCVGLIQVTGYDQYLLTSKSDWLDNYDFASYPNISSIKVRWYYGTNTSRTYGSSATQFVSVGTTYNTPPTITAIEWATFNTSYDIVTKTDDYSPAYNLYTSDTLFLAGEISSVAEYGGSGINYNNKCQRGILTGLYSMLQHAPTQDMVNNTKYYVPMDKETASRVVSTYGLYWTGTESVAATATTGSGATDDRLRLPVAKNGVFYGDYKKGKEIKDAPNADWGSNPDDPFDWWDDNGVTPSPDTNDYTDDTPLNRPSLTPFGVFNRAYAMTQSGLNDLSNYLWNKSDNIFNGLVDGLALMGNNPIDGIIDCRMYPFDVLSCLGSTGSQNITLGRSKTNVPGIHLGNATNCILDLGSAEFRKYHSEQLGRDCFLDYEPYTTGELYVPYVGTIPLNASIYAGHQISVKLIVDFMTGACEAVIFKDLIATDFKSGTIGVSIPVTGANAAQWANGVISSVLNGASGVANIAGGNVVGGGLQVANALVSGFNTPLPISAKGNASSACSQWLPQQAYLIVHSPITQIPTTYGSTIGYACEYASTLGSVTGYTVCADVNISGNFATESERKEIEDLLKGGIFI